MPGLPSPFIEIATAGQKRFSSDAAIAEVPGEPAILNAQCPEVVPVAASMPFPLKRRCISRLAHADSDANYEGVPADGPYGDVPVAPTLASQQCAEAPPAVPLLMPVKRRRLG